MKIAVTSAAAAFFGALLGFGGAMWVASAKLKAGAPFMTGSPIRTSELILEDEGRQPVIRLSTSKGETKLSFLGQGLQPALEIGVNQAFPGRYIRFFNEHGSLVVALNSAPPGGAAALYLGDDARASRVEIGALRAEAEVESWGFRLNAPGYPQPVFSVLTKDLQQPGPWPAGMQMLLPNGHVWRPWVE